MYKYWLIVYSDLKANLNASWSESLEEVKLNYYKYSNRDFFIDAGLNFSQVKDEVWKEKMKKYNRKLD